MIFVQRALGEQAKKEISGLSVKEGAAA